MKNRKAGIDMLHGPLAGKLILFALPLAASAVLQQLFNAADLAVVGRFANAKAMAAVGSNTFVISMLVSLFIGLSVGANVVISNLIGSRRFQEINDAVHTTMALALAAGFILLICGILLAPLILRLTGAPDDVLDLAIIYLRIYFMGMPAIMVYNFGSAVLRSEGDSRRPFISLSLAGILNILLNLLFVAVFHLHVVGVALATVLSNIFSAALALFFLIRETGDLHLNVHALHIRKFDLINIIRIGLPAGLQGMVFSLSNVVIQSAVNSFGADCIAGMSAAQNFDFISYCIINAFSQTTVTFVSQNYGAGAVDRCRKVTREALLICLGIDLAVLAFIEFGRSVLIQFFTNDPNVIQFAMVRFSYCISFHFLCSTYEIPGGALRGMNRSLIPAIISILGTCAFRLLYIFFVFPALRSIETLMFVYPCSWILTAIVMNAAYLRIVLRKN